jgi:YVTN family beta-propeller protein
MNKIFLYWILLFFYGCSSGSIEKFDLAQTSQGTWLPNGNFLTPAGTSIPIGDLPLGMALSPDKKNIVVVNSGYNEQTLSLINIARKSVVQTLAIRKSWMGAVWGPYGDYFFVTAGNDNKVYRYGYAKDSAWFIASLPIGKPFPEELISPTGITIDHEGKFIYTVARMQPLLFKLNAYENTIEKKIELEGSLYTCLLDEKRQHIYVSMWGSSSVAIVDVKNLDVIQKIGVGAHPSAMVMDSSNSRLFVTNSSENTVSVIDLSALQVSEVIDVGVVQNSLPGSTPNAITISNDNRTLFVANADNNAVAVVSLFQGKPSVVKGFIPTGWYPTAIVCSDSMVIVANGKGESSHSNPNRENPADLFPGTISFIPIPTDSMLNKYTQQVFKNNPTSRKTNFSDWNSENPIPRNGEKKSPIKHVFYIVKEMRSYDELFGDLQEGNGDTSLVKYGRSITPNHHALAEEYTLFDNFFVDGEIGADGLQWSAGAYATDYVEKTWPTLYGRRGGMYDYETDGMPTPKNGFIWDAVQKNKQLTMRNYGMFLNEEASERGEIMPLAKGLMNVTSPIYRGWDLKYYDTARVASWTKEFDLYEKGDSLPNFSIIRLPGDFTAGKKLKERSQQSYLADNDLALGRIIERISKSKYWKSSAIFVIESSAQGGADHVDAHRSIALVISPFAKRKFVDKTHYTTTSILRTMELILGIPAMTQHDSNAAPMYRAFTPVPDNSNYTTKPNTTPLNEITQPVTQSK